MDTFQHEASHSTSFNPYYSQPQSQPTNRTSSYGLYGGITNNIGNIYSDASAMNQPKDRAVFNDSVGSRPMYDQSGYQKQYNGMTLHPGQTVLGTAGKYAATGASAGPYGALIGGAVGLVAGGLKYANEADRKSAFNRSMDSSLRSYNSSLTNYNQHQASNDVSSLQQSQYGASNPYDAPTQSYWYV